MTGRILFIKTEFLRTSNVVSHKHNAKNFQSVTPAQAGVQNVVIILDSRFHGNDNRIGFFWISGTLH